MRANVVVIMFWLTGDEMTDFLSFFCCQTVYTVFAAMLSLDTVSCLKTVLRHISDVLVLVLWVGVL